MTNTARAIIKPGDTLNNGALVLEIKQRFSGEYVVLCRWDQSAQPYVTWALNGTTGEAYWGHYFHDLSSALADYTMRGE